MFQFVRGL